MTASPPAADADCFKVYDNYFKISLRSQEYPVAVKGRCKNDGFQ